MTKRKPMVLLFEDTKHNKTRIMGAAKLKKGVTFALFQPKLKQTDKAYEDRLNEELQQKEYCGVDLILCDRDLTMTDDYPGLSEAVVSKVADALSLPICLYASGVKDSVLERQRNWGDGRIVLELEPVKRLTGKTCIIAQGFQDLHQRLSTILKRSKRPETPSAVMAEVLNHSVLADRIALYGSGDQKMIAEFLSPVLKRRGELLKRLPVVFGYWLYESLLRFPGLLVNSVAAASYLNIDVAVFTKDLKVTQLFDSAKYCGPFADDEEPHWWRNDLDNIIFAAGCTDGRAFVEKELGQTVPECFCSLNKKVRAGYYCMITGKPISREYSRGNISWFPPGADLARINIKDYDQIGPWLGLY